MFRFIDSATLYIMSSACVVATICVIPGAQETFIIWLVAYLANIGDTLFHEMGHTVTGWAFGMPSIPSILTVFGADQAGGMTLRWPHSWGVQIGSLAVMAYGCYWTRDNFNPPVFKTVTAVALLLAALSFTPYTIFITTYMGHGGSIIVGGFFLFRAWLDIDFRNGFERWINAFLGFFLPLKNISFSYMLYSNASFSEEYSGKVVGGISHHDFMAMAMQNPELSVHGIALFTVCFGVAVIISSFVIAAIVECYDVSDEVAPVVID